VFEGSKELLLQVGANKPVGFLNLPIGLGVRHQRVLDLDAQLFGELLKFARGEVSTIVGDDAVGYPVRQVMESKNLTTVVASWLVTGTASIHLENLSTATKR
jgi:hypothetical protein